MGSNISDINNKVLSMLKTILDADKPYEQQWQNPITQTTNDTNLDVSRSSTKADQISQIRFDLKNISEQEKELSTKKAVLSGQLDSTTKTLIKIFEIIQPELTSLTQIIQDCKLIASQHKMLSERKTELQGNLISALEKEIKTEQVIKQ